MGSRLLIVAAGLALLSAPAPGLAAGPADGGAAPVRDCRCQSRQGWHPVGSVVCLEVGGRTRLAECVRVLNNTSWRMIGEGCPTARATLRPAGAGPS